MHIMTSSTTPYTFHSNSINPAVLNQSEFWRDKTGKLHRVEAMSRYHAIGAMRKLFGAFGAPVLDTPIYRALQEQSYERG